jgi:hypothetical protein
MNQDELTDALPDDLWLIGPTSMWFGNKMHEFGKKQHPYGSGMYLLKEQPEPRIEPAPWGRGDTVFILPDGYDVVGICDIHDERLYVEVLLFDSEKPQKLSTLQQQGLAYVRRVEALPPLEVEDEINSEEIVEILDSHPRGAIAFIPGWEDAGFKLDGVEMETTRFDHVVVIARLEACISDSGDFKKKLAFARKHRLNHPDSWFNIFDQSY